MTLGEVQYQVQLSRQLDPYSPGDRDLLKGVPPAERGARQGRDLVRRLGRRGQRDRQPADARRRVPDQRHDRQASSSRSRSQREQPVRLPARRHRGGRRLPAAGQRVRAVADDRRRSCSSACRGRRWTSARSSSSSPAPRCRARSRRSASTSEAGALSALQAGGEDVARDRGRGVAAGAGADEQDADRDPRRAAGRRRGVGDEPGVGVLRVRASCRRARGTSARRCRSCRRPGTPGICAAVPVPPRRPRASGAASGARSAR